jgi:hypothetical protein
MRSDLLLGAMWMGLLLCALAGCGDEPGKNSTKNPAVIEKLGLHDAGDEPRITLTMALDEGERYRMELVAEQSIHQGRESMDQAITMGVLMECQKVTDAGDLHVLHRIDHFAISSPAAGLEYDSKADGSRGNPMTAAFDVLVSESFTAVYDPTGKVSKVTGFDNLLEKMVQAVSGGDPSSSLTYSVPGT